MCGASARVSLTPSLLFRCTLRSCFNSAETFPSSCNSFVTYSTLTWSHETQIYVTRHLSQLRRAHLPFVAEQTRPSSWRGRGGGQKGAEELQKPGRTMDHLEPSGWEETQDGW